jgi:hypothetical protein
MTRDERIAKIRGGCRIRYSWAEEITARLDHLFQLPKTHRIPNLLIVVKPTTARRRWSITFWPSIELS